MKCSSCGTELTDVKAPCPTCGTVMEAKDDMDTIIANILEEEDYKPKFEDIAKDKSESDNRSNPKSTPLKVADRRAGAVRKARDGRKSKVTENGKARGRKGAKASVSLPDQEDRKRIGDLVVEGLRYFLVATILLFTLSIFFNWFTLKGEAVQFGVEGVAEVVSFLYQNGNAGDDNPVIVFSAMDLYRFGRTAAESYGTIIGPSGAETMSIVGVIQKYYMQSVILMIIINILSVILVLAFRKLNAIALVRNLSVVNFVVIGLNYLALKFTWFSMFAVKAKDILNQREGYHQISTAMEGILFDNTVYRYEMYHERGFTFAMIMLVLWLFVGIVLSEIKARRDEIAIETGESEQ